MYSVGQIKRGVREGIQHPILFVREANRLYYATRYGSAYNRDGDDFLAADWDTLIILDACRFDVFEELNPFDGDLTRKVSRASHTSQFLKGNFDGKRLTDTVYTTATPQLERYRDEVDVQFHDVDNVWNDERWDDEEGTVLPGTMTDAALDVHETYPDKRHVVHYMQPHYPFVGWDVDDGLRSFGETPEEGFDIWEGRIRGQVDLAPEDVWPAYRDNLEQVLEAVSTLVDEIEGKVVITSDHGNMVGERARPIPIREWGHPIGLYTDVLTEVPWLELTTGERRDVRSEERRPDQERVDADVVTDRLADLGYA